MADPTNPTTVTPKAVSDVPATYLDYWVYTARDADDQVLYVGFTGSGVQRFKAHRVSADWGRLVARFDVEHFDSPDVALARERHLIGELDPPYNVNHRPTPEPPPVPLGPLTVHRAAEELNVSGETIRRYLQGGDLRGFQLPGGTWRIYPESLAELVGEPIEQRRTT